MFSSLPCEPVIYDFFKQYKTKRQPDRESTTGILKGFYESAVSKITGKKTPTELMQDIKDKIIADVDKIKSRKNFEDKFGLWIDLIFKLGEEAEEAQKLRYESLAKFLPITLSESLLCETLHALRSYILYSFLKGNDAFSHHFKEYILALKTLASELKNKLYTAVFEDRGEDAEGLLKHINDITIKLAFLGDIDAIIEARKNKLLDSLSIYNFEKLTQTYEVPTETANHFVPYSVLRW